MGGVPNLNSCIFIRTCPSRRCPRGVPHLFPTEALISASNTNQKYYFHSNKLATAPAFSCIRCRRSYRRWTALLVDASRSASFVGIRGRDPTPESQRKSVNAPSMCLREMISADPSLLHQWQEEEKKKSVQRTGGLHCIIPVGLIRSLSARGG